MLKVGRGWGCNVCDCCRESKPTSWACYGLRVNEIKFLIKNKQIRKLIIAEV